MPDANDDRPTDRPDPGALKPNTDEATIRAEDAHEDAETAQEAMDEALKEGAVPYARVKNERADPGRPTP